MTGISSALPCARMATEDGKQPSGCRPAVTSTGSSSTALNGTAIPELKNQSPTSSAAPTRLSSFSTAVERSAGLQPVVFGKEVAWRANQEMREFLGAVALVAQNR